MSVPATIESPATEARTLIARSLDAVVVPPYYQDDYVAIWHGNNQELLSLMPACDLLLTDPPYGIGFAHGGGGGRHRSGV